MLANTGMGLMTSTSPFCSGKGIRGPVKATNRWSGCHERIICFEGSGSTAPSLAHREEFSGDTKRQRRHEKIPRTLGFHHQYPTLR